KNFAANGIARRLNCHSLNVKIDTDTRKSATLVVPSWGSNPADVRLHHLAYDRWGGEVAFFNTDLQDRKQFQNFAADTHGVWGNWPFQPILPDYWALIVEHLKRGMIPRSAFGFDVARYFTEQAWGVKNQRVQLYLLVMRVPEFCLQLLLDLPRFHAVYNQCV